MSVKNKNFTTASVIYTLIFAVFMVLIWNLPSDRLYVGIALVLFPLFLTASIIVGIKFKNISGHILSGLIIGSVLTMLALVFWGLSRYTFVYNSFSPFWAVSLIIGVLVALFLCIKFLRKRFKILGLAGYFILIAVIVFVISVSYINNLNYALDFSKPAEQSAVIEEKDWDRSTRGPDSYEFKVTSDGESFDLEVSSEEYYYYEEGDLYLFKKYKGAFNEPFFIAEN